MKIIAKSKNGKMLKIGESEESCKWYFIAENVLKFASSLNVKETVNIKHEQRNGKLYLTFISKGDAPAPSSKPSGSGNSSSGGYKGKTDKEIESIERQVVLKVVGQGLIALQGHVTPQNIDQISINLFNTLISLM